MNKFRAALLVGVLSLGIVFPLWTVFQNIVFKQNEKQLEIKAKNLINQGSVGIFFGLESIFNVVESFKHNIERGSFSQEEFSKNAKVAFQPFSKFLKAINFVDKDYIIKYVYPEAINSAARGKNLENHFESAISQLFAGDGPSKVDPSFIEPVSLIQGGVGMIYYLPINNGWINVVIDVQDFFENFEIELLMKQGAKIALKDDTSGKYFFKHINFNEAGRVESTTKKFMNKDLRFEIDLSDENQEIIQSYRLQLFYGFVVILFLSVAKAFGVYFFLKTKEKYENLHDESTILKILVHDISNYLQSLGGSLTIIQKKYEDPVTVKNFVEMAIPAFNSAKETLNTTRGLYQDRVDFQSTMVEPRAVLEDLESAYNDIIEDRKIKLEVIGSEKFKFVGEPTLFKNQIISNLFLNCLKHADENTTVKVFIDKEKIVFKNYSQEATPDRIKTLNTLKGFGDERKRSKTGLGFGFTIAKLTALNFNMKVDLKAGFEAGEVITTLRLKR